MRGRTLAWALVSLLTLGSVLLSAHGKLLGDYSLSAVGAGSSESPGGQMPPDFDQEVARVVAELDHIEADTLRQMDHTALDRLGQIRTLGKLLLFDKYLSANQNEACSFCHTPETGFTGPIESLNLTTVSYPGSVRTRFSNRKPQSYRTSLPAISVYREIRVFSFITRGRRTHPAIRLTRRERDTLISGSADFCFG